MKISVDTNILVRAVVLDDAKQGEAAAKLLTDASLVAIALPCLCELVWVLRRLYGLKSADVSMAIRALLAASNVL